MPDATNFVPSL